MRVTIFIGSLTGGGAERVACNLATFLSEKHNELTMLTMSEDSSYVMDDMIKRVPLIRTKEKRNFVFDNVLRYRRLKEFVTHSDTDVYICMLHVTSCLLIHFRDQTAAPIVYSERCDPNSYSYVAKKALRKFLPKADGAVFQTEDAQRCYDGIITKNSIVIPNAVNPEFVREAYRGERRKTVVAAGRLTEQKNFPLLIRAFGKASASHPEQRLVIYGQGEQLESLKALVTELKIEEKVEFPGYVDNFGDHIIDAGMFVLPSNYEGMPNALMEAMALGLPCIATDCPCGGSRYLIQNGLNGLLVPTGDVDALAQAMDKLLSDTELASKLGENARRIAEDLDADKIYGQWETFIKETREKKQ